MDRYQMFINGEFVDARSKATSTTIDPGTGLPIAELPKAGREDAEDAIRAARQAFDRGPWPRMTPQERARKCYAFADQIAAETLRICVVEAMDSGQVIGLTKYWGLTVATTIRNLGYLAANDFPWVEDIPFSGNVFAPGREYIRREPIGVCVGIIPWNFPISMATWKIAQAILMGNTVVLKPASVTPLSALIMAEAAQKVGLPPGVVNVITGSGGELGQTLCTHPDVDKIAFTGSTLVGTEIMKMASDNVKKVTLELGGKSANIILEDADMDLAVEGASYGTFFHQGQVCESGTRILVSSKIHDEFVDRLKKRTEALRVGYQMLPTSHQGPLASENQRRTVESYVALGREEGATLCCGGKRVEVPGFEGGYYYAPTIFTDVKNSMRIAQEEIFGPVVCVQAFDSDEEAIAIANDSMYGLAGGVFSTDNGRAERIAAQMRTGTVWINNYHSFGDFCPFGGYKQSGVGRELGAAGLDEYTQIKRVHVSAVGSADAHFQFKIHSDNPRLSAISYNSPTHLVAGHGALAGLPHSVTQLGCRRPFILTDAGVRAVGLTALVEKSLGALCVGSYDEIPADSDLATVDRAAAAARAVGADCIVSVGGGSVIDTAKAVCVTLTNGGEANDHLAIQRLTEDQTPHIAIPTTAGTGSEVTNVAVIHNEHTERKAYIVDDKIIPRVAFLDPRCTQSLPRHLTAATGMDAMTHAIEAMTSTLAQPVCDGQALQAIRLLKRYLPTAVADGQNEEARVQVSVAAAMAGWAFSTAQVGLAHSMAHTIGIMAHVHHGTACGIFLPKVMRYNVDHATSKLAQIAEALEVDTRNLDERAAALAAADAVEALMDEIGHPRTLKEVGVDKSILDVAAFHALSDSATLFNARPVSDPGDVLNLLNEAY